MCEGTAHHIASEPFPPLSAYGTFPHELGKGKTKLSESPLLPFMGEMASGQRGRGDVTIVTEGPEMWSN